jgi:hypothetical protein
MDGNRRDDAMNQDLEHLRLLSIFHYVVGGLTALFACFPLIHLTVGLVMLFAPASLEHGQHGAPNDPAILRAMGLLFTIFAGGFILAGWSLAVCVFLAGGYLRRRRHYMFCLVIAALLCMMAPFGTVLGVFTIVVLLRPSVKLLFDPQAGSPVGSG